MAQAAQAFASMQRALRESDQRVAGVHNELISFTGTVEGKLHQLESKAQQRDEQLRMESREALSDLEELVLQMYAEQRKALAEQHDAITALKAQHEAELQASRSAAAGQKRQLDELMRMLSLQQQVINEHIGASGARASAVEKKASAAEAAVGSHRSEVEESLRAMSARLTELLTSRSDGVEASAQRRVEAMEARICEAEARLGSVLSWRPQLVAREKEATDRHSASQLRLDALQAQVDKADARASEMHAEMGARCADAAAESSRKLHASLQQMRQETVQLLSRKVDSREVAEWRAAVDERMTAMSQQLPPIVAEIGELGRTAQTLLSRCESNETREARLLQEQQDFGHAHEQLAGSVDDIHSLVRSTQHGLGALVSAQQELETHLRCLESSVLRVSSASEEQGRYLNQVSESLHDQQIVPQKFRSKGISHQAYACENSPRSPNAASLLGNVQPFSNRSYPTEGGGFVGDSPEKSGRRCHSESRPSHTAAWGTGPRSRVSANATYSTLLD